MRPAALLAQLAFWASTASAFYPFPQSYPTEAEDRSHEDARRSVEGRAGKVVLEIERRTGQSTDPPPTRALKDATRLSSRYGARAAARNGGDSDLVPRSNDFEIQDAVDSGTSMTAGIDQDGTDYSYFVQAQLGSKGTKLYMLIDTGAGSSWVMGTSCTTSACSMHNRFGSDDSDTYEASSDDFDISYGSGTVSGELATDTISLAGMSLKYQFGVATNASDAFTHFAFDGILGLSMNKGANENFLDAIAEAGEVDHNIFSVALNRASDGTNNGEITFGSTDSSRYTGDITYTAVGSDDGDWAIKLDDISYDGNAAGVGGILAYIDTGTSFIFGPPDVVKQLHSVIPGADSSDGTSYTVPCDSEQPLTFTFSGVDFNVSTKDWVSSPNSAGDCTSNVYGQEVVSGAWLLGDTFIKNVYAIFDKDETRVGFAVMADESDSSSSSATTTEEPAKTSTMVDMVTRTATNGSVITTSTTIVTALPETSASSRPSMGLTGPETAETKGTSGSSPSETGKPDSNKKSAAPGSSFENMHYASTVCLVVLVALLA